MVFGPRRRIFFVGSADLADNDYRVGLVVFLKQFQSILMLGPDDRVPADTYSSRLPESQRGQLSYGLVGQRAGTRDHAYSALFVNVARHNADLTFSGRNDPRTI